MRGIFKRLRRDRRGNMAMLTALMIIPVAAMLGGALDVVRAITLKERLQTSIDAAALAAGSAIELSTGELETLANDYFNANVATADRKGGLTITDVVAGEEEIRITAHAELDTSFLGLVGINTLTVNTTNTVLRKENAVQLAMVLDNTGSMNSSGKIEALRAAAHDLVDILYGPKTSSDMLSISLVPFVTAVNIKTEGFDYMSWMDTEAKAKYHGYNFEKVSGENANHFDLFEDMGKEWKGCVEVRPDSYAFEDSLPQTSVPDSLFVPYLWPDEPSTVKKSKGKVTGQTIASGYRNSYFYDDKESSSDLDTRQKSTSKYKGTPNLYTDTPKNTVGPNRSCPSPITWFTGDRSEIEDAIDAMDGYNDGGTNIAEGLSWGKRVLSPGEPFDNPVPYNDEDTIKTLILMTDGRNEVVAQTSNNGSDYNSLGYIRDKRMASSISAQVTALNTKTSELCEGLKADGVVVYTILFMETDSKVKTMLRNCASEPSYFFDSPNSAALKAAFKTIGKKLTQLRIAH